MKDKTKRIIVGISTIILVLIMIYFIDFRLFIENLAKISIYGILLFTLIYTIVFFFRTYRLKLIFRGLNLETPSLILFGSYGIGWGINEITPGKLGDLARIEFIHQKENTVSLSKSFCGITIERFIDLLILMMITAFALVFMYINNVEGTTQLNLHFYIGIGALILIGGCVVILVLFFKSSLFLNIVGKISIKLKNRLEIFLRNFLIGMNDFRKNRKKAVAVGVLSIPIWLCETFTLVLLFYLIGYEINIFIIILAQLVLFFTKTFPITPGGWVISENLGALIIFFFYPSIPYGNLLSIFILDHVLRVAYCIIYGSSSTLAFNYRFKKIDVKNIKIENSNS